MLNFSLKGDGIGLEGLGVDRTFIKAKLVDSRVTKFNEQNR